MDKRRITALMAGIACVVAAFAAGCNNSTPDESASPSPDAAASPAAGGTMASPAAGGTMASPAAGGAMATPGTGGAAAPPGPAAK